AFHFVVPLALSREPAAEAPYRQGGLKGVPVLVVDDNRTNRRILEEVLTSWGLRPSTADGGAAALDEMARAAGAGVPFRLALLDAMMPDMDGFALAQRI